MIVKVRRTSLFGDMEPTVEFISSVLGTPVKDGDKQIGIVCGYNDKTDLFSFDIDDDYKERFLIKHDCSMEIQNG